MSTEYPVTDLNTLSSQIADALTTDELTSAADLLKPIPAYAVVALMKRMNQRHRAVVFRLLPKNDALEVFEALNPALQNDLVSGLLDQDVTELFASLDPDDRVSLLDELPSNVAHRLLRGLTPAERKKTGVVLGYPPGSVGRRMSPEFIATRYQDTAAQALERVLAGIGDAETVYVLPVFDDQRRVVGVVGLRELLAADADTPVTQLVDDAHVAVATEPAAAIARICTDRNLLAVPVVDSESRLLGILTVDDATEILESEETQHAARQGGANALDLPYLATSLLVLVRSRALWLLVLAVGAAMTVQILSHFEDALTEATVLSLFVPLLIGIGGNTGNQAATTVTRAIALGDLTSRELVPVLTRELRVGFLLGSLLGVLGLLLTGLLYGPEIGAVIALTLLALCTIAATLGGAMPLIAKAVRVDPAVFSNPFISTVTDATGLIIYFLIARAVLGL
ncbi:magnesium transporter [Dietzia lutea]|uniref:Magnesium transporter MgtE n=1 Tax=Dietzia lutea TaxID=546160 RepID=A0A2S1R3T8_9ACTN|nr:magnesium transporter [Dietzia lutea]AWH90921.1 magnesium transporter [Dietzia lutea]